MADRSIKGINIKIGGETTGLQKALSEVNGLTRELQGELRKVDNALKFSPSSVELITQKQKILTDTVATTKDKLDQLKQAEKEVQGQFERGEISEEQYRALQREIVETESKLKHYETALKGVGGSYDELNAKMIATGEKLKETGKNVEDVGKKFLPASAVATGALAGMFKSTMDFDSAWTGVQKTMADDITPEQLDAIKEGLKGLSKETGVSTTELGAVAEAAGQLGIKTENILSFTKTMTDMGVATNISAEDAAASLARFANVTQMSQGDFDKLGSVIVELGNNFATTEKDIVEMSMNLGAAGTQIGMSQSDIVALATSLSSVGLEAAAGGTSFSKLMVNMQLAVETGSDELEDFASVAGMTSAEFKQAFETDATGALQKFIGGLSDTGEAGDSAIKILDDMGIKETRLRDSILRSAGASDLLTEATKMGNEAWQENSALTTEADLRYQSVEGKMNQMKASISVMATNLGEHLIPMLTSLFEWIANLADKFGNLSPTMQKVVVAAIGIVAAIGPVLIIIGKLITAVGVISGAIGAAGGVAGIAATAMGGLSAAVAFITGPIGLAIAAIAAIIAIGVLLYKNWDTIKEAAGKLIAGITGAFSRIGEIIGTLVSNIIQGFVNLPSRLLTIGGNVIGSLGKGITNALGSIGTAVGKIITSIINAFTSLPSKLMSIGGNIMSGLIKGITGKVGEIMSTVGNIASNIAGKLKGFFGIRSPSRLMMEMGDNVGEGFAIGIKDSLGSIENEAMKMGEVVSEINVNPADIGAGAGQHNSNNTTQITLGGTFHIREESDIQKVAEELMELTLRKQRA